MRFRLHTAIVFLFATTLHAQEIAFSKADGNTLLAECSEITSQFESGNSQDGSIGDSYCLGMVNGMMNLNYIYQSKLGNRALFCLPSDRVITNAEAAQTVVSYLEKHPDQLHEDQASLMFFAFEKAWPCQ
ncbi:MAG: hypothetical protein VR73_13835 [Gammaproteobacteria bacterium BRH_c0]|nr:MAG: hypothetical protein VR73_13835 [Gammaproteobacteria bacterium BRH_c0]